MANFVDVGFFEFVGLKKWQWNHDDNSKAVENEKKEKGEREGKEKKQEENHGENKEREAISRTMSEMTLCLVMDRFAPS
jgi:hypothetical protein